jgi:hypothetical protein
MLFQRSQKLAAKLEISAQPLWLSSWAKRALSALFSEKNGAGRQI